MVSRVRLLGRVGAFVVKEAFASSGIFLVNHGAESSPNVQFGFAPKLESFTNRRRTTEENRKLCPRVKANYAFKGKRGGYNCKSKKSFIAQQLQRENQGSVSALSTAKARLPSDLNNMH